MRFKIYRRQAIIFLLLILEIIALSADGYVPQDRSAADISPEDVNRIIQAENETRPSYRLIDCGGDITITQKMFSDIDRDGVKEVIINVACYKVNSVYGYVTYVFVLSKTDLPNWALEYDFKYFAFNSNVYLDDMEQDGLPEILIRANMGQGGGSGGFANGIQDIFIKCTPVECKMAYRINRFLIGWQRFHSVTDIRGFFPSFYFLHTTDFQSIGNGQLLETSSSISWYAYVHFIQTTYTVYELDGLEYQELYHSSDGNSYYLDQYSSYQYWQNNLSEYSLDSGGVWPYVNSFQQRGFSDVFTDAESAGFIQRNSIFYLGSLSNPEGAAPYTSLVVGQENDEECKISLFYYSLYDGLTEARQVENCRLDAAKIMILKLNPRIETEYIIFSTLLAPLSQEPPYQVVSIYKWDPYGNIGEEGILTEVDRLSGRLYVAKQDGVTITCDGITSCTARVRVWQYDTYENPFSLPYYENYTWDSDNEKFIPVSQTTIEP